MPSILLQMERSVWWNRFVLSSVSQSKSNECIIINGRLGMDYYHINLTICLAPSFSSSLNLFVTFSSMPSLVMILVTCPCQLTPWLLCISVQDVPPETNADLSDTQLSRSVHNTGNLEEGVTLGCWLSLYASSIIRYSQMSPSNTNKEDASCHISKSFSLPRGPRGCDNSKHVRYRTVMFL